MSYSWFSFVFAATLAIGPALAEGKVPLPDEAHINEQLIAAAAGDMLRKTCPTLAARAIVVFTKLAQLEGYARSKGYTEEEVTVFLKDRVQKARVKSAARAYLASAGVIPDDVASYCKAGLGEIAKGTLTGSLLRSTE